MVDETGKYLNECFFIAPIGAEDSEIRKRSDGVMQFIVQKAAEEFYTTQASSSASWSLIFMTLRSSRYTPTSDIKTAAPAATTPKTLLMFIDSVKRVMTMAISATPGP